MENLIFYVTCLTILIVLVILLAIMICQSDKKPHNSIQEIFEELKKDGIIENDRKLKPKENLGGFAAGFFPKRIYFDPEICEINKKTIKFCLLHEEGHIKEGHCGILLWNIITIGGGGLIIIDVVWVLNHLVALIPSIYFNFEIWLLSLTWGVFLVTFCTRLASHPLQIDEYISDRWASEKLRDIYQINEPSLILDQALDELDKYREKVNKSNKGFLYCIRNSLREYHPLNEQRIAHIIFSVDKK